MGIIILLINQAWGESPLLLFGMLVLGAILAAEIGLILGTMINEMNTLFAVWKFGGLYSSASYLYMFLNCRSG